MTSSSSQKSNSLNEESNVERELNDVSDDITLNSGSQNTNLDPTIENSDFDLETQNNNTESAFNPEVSTIENIEDSTINESETLGFTPGILKSVNSEDGNVPIMNRENLPINELGFKESIAIPIDFQPEDIKLELDTYGFSLFSVKGDDENNEKSTLTYHQMRYTRLFDRPIRNVDMEFIEGKVYVYGEFDDYVYPQ